MASQLGERRRNKANTDDSLEARFRGYLLLSFSHGQGIRRPPIKSTQIAFAQGVADGQAQLDAYCSAYPRSSVTSAKANASRLMERTEVGAYLSELRAQTETSQTLTRQGKREILAGMARDESAPWAAPLRAIDLDSRMAGHYEIEQVKGKFSVVIGGNWEG